MSGRPRRPPPALAILAIAALVVAAALAAGCGRESKRQVNIYIWTNYLPDAVVRDFERRTGIDVQIDTYDSNEALLAKLQSGVADYDLVVPSDYMLKILDPPGAAPSPRPRAAAALRTSTRASSTRSSIPATATRSLTSGGRRGSATTGRKSAR